jgi:hypothetical protein
VPQNLFRTMFVNQCSMGLALSWSKIKKLKFASSFASPDFFF